MSEEPANINQEQPRSLVQFLVRYTIIILYKERNYTEAQFFMDNITNYLNLQNAKVLDLACGKGHSTI
jgi:hypothetical protein